MLKRPALNGDFCFFWVKILGSDCHTISRFKAFSGLKARIISYCLFDFDPRTTDKYSLVTFPVGEVSWKDAMVYGLPTTYLSLIALLGFWYTLIISVSSLSSKSKTLNSCSSPLATIPKMSSFFGTIIHCTNFLSPSSKKLAFFEIALVSKSTCSSLNS